jgi:uncharacterized membrane protein YkoI
MRRPSTFLLVVGFSVALMTLGDPVHSQYEDDWQRQERDHDRARQAVRRGEVLPMAKVLERLYARIPGEVVGVEFEREDGRWIYEFKLVDRIGRLLEVQVDAATGNILSTEVD